MASFAKWIGGGLGWAFGGPIGGILGFMFGSVLDGTSIKTIGSGITTSGDFSVSLLVLSAAIMKADGKVMKSELDYVKRFFVQSFGEDQAAEKMKILREILNVSQLSLKPKALEVKPDGTTIHATFSVRKADGQKCERCWHWETDIGQNAEHPMICGRCVEAVLQFKA